MNTRIAALDYIAENAKGMPSVEIVVMVRELAQELPAGYQTALFGTDVAVVAALAHLDVKQDTLMILIAELEARGVLRGLEEKLVFDLVG